MTSATPPNARLLLGIAGLVTLAAALGVTGFVAPGFFLSSENEKSAPVDELPADSGPVLTAFVADLSAGDTESAQARLCDPDDLDDDVARIAAGGADLRLTGDAAQTAGTVRADVTGNIAGGQVRGVVHAVRDREVWCVDHFEIR